MVRLKMLGLPSNVSPPPPMVDKFDKERLEKELSYNPRDPLTATKLGREREEALRIVMLAAQTRSGKLTSKACPLASMSRRPVMFET